MPPLFLSYWFFSFLQASFLAIQKNHILLSTPIINRVKSYLGPNLLLCSGSQRKIDGLWICLECSRKLPITGVLNFFLSNEPMISPSLLSISYAFLQYDLFRSSSWNRNLYSPVTIRKEKSRQRWFISAVSIPSSSEKTWELSEPPTSLIDWKLCKGRNYKGRGRFKGPRCS